MADEMSDHGSDATELDTELDLDEGQDLESAMRDAVAAVEVVESGGAPAAATAGAEPAAEVVRLRREIADLRDRSVRTLADFDNYRKRAERERQDAKRYALLEPLRDLLSVVDNLERALSAEGSADDLKRGVEMTLKGMRDLLRRHGVVEVEATGAAFDPAVHEAVARQEDPAVQVPTVLAELQRGYFLHDRLLRPAMVKVGMPAERKGDAGGNGAPTAH